MKEEEKKPEPPEELRRDVRKPAPIRPWDIGKENTTKILSQEEWIEKKRSERNEEFAPPISRPSRNHPTKRQIYCYSEEKTVAMEPVPIKDESEEDEECRGKGIEIPPPPTFEIYGPSSKSRRTHFNLNNADIDKSIEEGLNFLRRQVEEKQARRRREEEIELM